MASIAATLDNIAKEIPDKEAVQYKHKNLKWSRSDVKDHADALASGLVELQCRPGDVMAVWLPENAEKHIAQLAAAKAGVIFAAVDPALNTPEAISKVLKETAARVVIVEEGLADALRQAVPELGAFDLGKGLPFRSSGFPNLKHAIHTGFDFVPGLHNYKHVTVYNYHSSTSPLQQVQAAIKESTPLALSVEKGSGGEPRKGKLLTQTEVLQQKAWPTVASILAKQYVEL